MKFSVLASFIALANVGCASERLNVSVVDDEGRPVTNATVHLGFLSGHVVFAEGKPRHYSARTDKDGKAVVKFDGDNSDVYWSVTADGCYPSGSRKATFLIDVKQIPPLFYTVTMLEHEKNVAITLYRKKNPQPMYAYSWQKKVESPIANGRYGFDLQSFDWLPPLGNGEIADFYYVRDRQDVENVKDAISKNRGYTLTSFRNGTVGFPKIGDVVGRIEFDDKCGAYVGNCTGNENFPSVHCADTNKTFVASFPICVVPQQGNIWLHEGDVIGDDKYMVIRSRVKCDEHGNIVSANYSKLIGPVGFGSTVGIKESVFNPRPNDTNLEFDPERNLYQGREGAGRIP